MNCAPRAQHHAVRLRVASVAGVACCVEDRIARRVIQDRRAPVVPAIGIRLGEIDVAPAIHAGDSAIVRIRNGIRGVDHARRVRVRDVERVHRSNVPHEGQVVVVGGEVQSQFRLRAEAADELIARAGDVVHHAVGYFKRADGEAPRRDLVEEDARSDAEAAIDGSVVENIGESAIGDGAHAVARGAVRRELLADGDVRGEVIVDGAADHKIAGIELGEVALVVGAPVLCREAGSEGEHRQN